MITLDPVPYSAFAELYPGGTQGNPYEMKITLFRNAWRAYKLPSPYKITSKTRISFKASITDEVNGHALCVAFDDHADTSRRCLMIGGHDFGSWTQYGPKGDVDLAYSKMVNIALGRPVRQSSTKYHSLGDAAKAVDG
eukprot:CAMPEP_0197244330 /NCGR_PEP_ID=MMETSP1429-20130617/9488_1 /TAXON_ID=49237 /ORGANISM="Chaetoceros  sp., Strain UNC1202" /LENGTH=137 /DNA_ID=CAMNT_0042704675 /DNA_START=255 /DNA_END=665 /DNA_ORIENTATION=+